MAQYIGTVQGGKGQASRIGNKVSGLMVTCSGWDVGVIAEIKYEGGKDVIYIYETGGSNDKRSKLIKKITKE